MFDIKPFDPYYSFTKNLNRLITTGLSEVLVVPPNLRISRSFIRQQYNFFFFFLDRIIANYARRKKKKFSKQEDIYDLIYKNTDHRKVLVFGRKSFFNDIINRTCLRHLKSALSPPVPNLTYTPKSSIEILSPTV